MARIQLDVSLIRNSKSKDFVAYLNQLQQHHSRVDICRSLFAAVDREQLPPSIFTVFISWSGSVDVIALCIGHGPARSIRTNGIQHFSYALANHREWESAWRAVGGVEGLVDQFAKASVTEVKALARAIGRCSRGKRRPQARENAIEELLRALLPLHYEGTKIQSHDKRPIQDYYAEMVCACSPVFVARLMDARDQSNPLYRQLRVTRLIKSHGQLLQTRLVEAIFGNGVIDNSLGMYLETFATYHSTGAESLDARMSASMAFTLRILQTHLVDINDERWPNSVSEADLVFSLLHRSLKRRLSEARIHDIVMLGLLLLEAKPSLERAFKSWDMWSTLIHRWMKAPKTYEDSLVLAFRLHLGGSQTMISRHFLETSRALEKRPELRWPLLRLYCLHVPKVGIDLDTATDYKLLAHQTWSSRLFDQLGKDHAVRLLKGLHNANPDYNFLEVPAHNSILSTKDVMSQKNFNVILLLTVLQCDSEEIQRKAASAVSELRMRSSSAKEQSERALFAKAASSYAIASGSLQLYGETISWLQRFVSDPLTSKLIFGRGTVVTSEGIELLSGIPQPLPEDMTLEDIASEVKKANNILMTLYDTMRLAKKSPSFHLPDWAGLMSLFGAAIDERVTRAEAEDRLRSSGSDVYSAIWANTLDTLQKVDVDFLNSASVSIKRMLKTLPLTALAATTKSMLEAGNERREKQDREVGDSIMERLSYEALLQVAGSEKPELAQKLVLRTILDRPDASAWHRYLLSVSFLNKLSSKDAQEILLAFANAIGEKLEEQSYVKIGEAQPTPVAPSQPLVKVTTVKYLAQLLDNAKFISADAAGEVLVQLFKAGTHRDIRLATLGSLLSLLTNLSSGVDESWRSNALAVKIMAALDTIIPVVGSINERRPPRLEDWEEARRTGTLLEASKFSTTLPPLWNALYNATDPEQNSLFKNLQADIVTRYILPSVEYSQIEHRKWVALFLAKHKANFTVDDLPNTPTFPNVWTILITKHSKIIPQMVWEDINKHVVLSIAPPVALKDFNASLRDDVELVHTPEVARWLAIFGQRLERYQNSGTQKLVAMIHHDWPHSSVSNGIGFDRVLEMVIEHASLFLDDYERYANVWNDFTYHLGPPKRQHCTKSHLDELRSECSMWQKTGRVMLEKVIALVLEKKNEHASVHMHSFLPSTTKLRLYLLPYPCLPDPADIASQCKVLAEDMEKLLESLLNGKSNVLHWPQIAEEAFLVSDMLYSPEERLHLAIYIGGLVRPSAATGDQHILALNLVRVTFAMKLIEDGDMILWRDYVQAQGGLEGNMSSTGKQAHDLIRLLRAKIEEWQGYEDEGVREKVADWRRKRKDIWGILMGKSE